MAGPSVVLDNPYHARSTSIPTRLRTISFRVEEELDKVKALAAPLLRPVASPPLSADVVSTGLAAVANLYDCMEGLLAMPHAQQAVRRIRGEKKVADLLEGSLRLLDVCCGAKDALLLIRERVQDVQFVLRRRCGGSAMAGALSAYMITSVKAKKDVGKGLKALKHIDSGTALDRDANVSTVVRVLEKARALCASFLQALLSLLSPSTVSRNPRPSKWSLISIALLGSKHSGMVEVDTVDELICSLHRNVHSKEGAVDATNVQTLQRHLETLEARLVCLEDALDFMYRRLIQNRVSLLNILSV